MKWRMASGHSFQLRVWDAESVAYHEPSGDTHLLGEAATALLLTLGEGGAQDTAVLASHLARELEMPQTGELIEVTQTVLSELRSLALVESIQS